MPQLHVEGFWSYARADDEGEGGRVVALAEDLRVEYAATTGEELVTTFVDVESLKWGDKWREEINESIARSAFLVPIVTPRYFLSQACRDELLGFAAEADRRGASDLVLPVYWLTVADLADEAPADEAMALIKSCSWQDLRPVRLLDRTSAEYRLAVHKLALEMASRIERLSAAVVAEAPVPSDGAAAEPPGEAPAGDSEESGDEPGVVEMLAAGEEALEGVSVTLGEVGTEIETVGALTESATLKLNGADQRHQGFAARLRIIRQLSADLMTPSNRIAELGQLYGAQLRTVDPMVREVIRQGHAAETDEDKAAAAEAFRSLLGLVAASDGAIKALQGLSASSIETGQLSSTMRPPLKALRLGLQGIMDGQPILREWRELIDRGPDDNSHGGTAAPA